MPWYDHVVRSDSEEDLYKPRDSREYIMERVLENLNYACEHCYTSEAWVDNQKKINRYIALAIKSRICLFEGATANTTASIRRRARRGIPGWQGQQMAARGGRACEELMEAASTRSSTRRPTWPQYRSLFTSIAQTRR